MKLRSGLRAIFLARFFEVVGQLRNSPSKGYLLDALKPLGVHHLDMPATPEKLWRLIQEHRTPLAAE